MSIITKPILSLMKVSTVLKVSILLIISIMLLSCKGIAGAYSDGVYCADVHYHNPKTGTEKDYTLDVELYDGEMVKMYFNNGGWLDDSHFDPENITDGDCTFYTDRGYEYKVKLKDSGKCD